MMKKHKSFLHISPQLFRCFFIKCSHSFGPFGQRLGDESKTKKLNGFTVFLKEAYQSSHCCADAICPDEHWFQKRQRIFKNASNDWKNISHGKKRQFGEIAKGLNYESKKSRLEKQTNQDEMNEVRAHENVSVEHKQMKLVKSAINSRCLLPVSSIGQSIPSLIRPQMLARHANEHGMDPLPIANNAEGNMLVSVESSTSCGTGNTEDTCATVSTKLIHECSNVDMIEAAKGLAASGPALHGLGDDNFGVSEAMVDHVIENTKGFVENGHRQFQSQHGHICDKPALEFDDRMDEDDDIFIPKSCEHLCGRYCLRTIKNKRLFANATEMIKSIARILAKKRTIKLGKQIFLSPSSDTYWPALVVVTSNPEVVHARLAFRVSFSPLEVDWIHCTVERDQDDFHLTPKVQEWPSSDRLFFVTDAAHELAAWFSLEYDESWKFTDLVMRVRSLRVRSGGYEISKNHVFSLFYAFVIKGSGLQPKTNQNNATSKLIGKN